MLKFYVAYLSCEIIARFRRNIEKKQLIAETFDAFNQKKKNRRAECRKEDKNLSQDDSDEQPGRKGKVKMNWFHEHISNELGYFEAERYKAWLVKQQQEGDRMPMQECMDELTQMYDDDINLLIQEAFDRLCIESDTVHYRYLYQGFMVNYSTHTVSGRKQMSRALIEEFRFMEKRKQSETIEKDDFVETFMETLQENEALIINENTKR